MVDPRWRKILRDLWLHRARTFLVILAVAVGVAGAGAVLDTWSLIRRVTRDSYLASNPASATIRIDSVDAEVITRVKALPAVADVQARRTVIARAQGTAGWVTAILFANDDFDTVRIGKLETEPHSWPPADSSFVIERSSLDFSGASVGDPLVLSFGDHAPLSLPVTGIARDVGLAPGWMEHVVYGFVNLRTLSLIGAAAFPNELQLTVRDRTLDRDAVRRIAYEAKAVIEATGHRVVDVDVPVPGKHIHADQMNSLLYTQGGFGLLALILSGFLVVNLIAAMLAGQVREIAVMKTIGAQSGQIAALYLTLALVLGLTAATLAIPTAAVVGRRYAALKAELLNFDITGYGIPVWSILVQLAAAALLPLAAAAIPVWKGCRISVSAALRDVGIRTDDYRAGLARHAGGLARPLLLSLRNAFRRRQRMALTLLALAMGGAVYLGALNLESSVHRAVDLLFAPQRFDLTVRVSRRGTADSLERLVSAVGGVAATEAWGVARAAVAKPDGTLGNSFVITGPPAETRLLEHAVTSGRWLRSGDGRSIVVNRAFLRDEPEARVGGEIALIIGGHQSTWTIVGAVETVPSPAAYAPRETIAELVGGGLVDFVVVDAAIDGPASQIGLIQQLRSELERQGYPVQSTQLLSENRRVMEDHLVMVADFLGIVAWLMIVIGGLGLASTMSLAVLERTREIGVMRAIGARHRAILTIVQVEGLVIAGLSWLIAIPLSIPMSVILARAFGRIMIPVPIRLAPPSAGVAAWLGLAVGVSLLACAWPAIRAMRVPTAVALAYE